MGRPLRARKVCQGQRRKGRSSQASESRHAASATELREHFKPSLLQSPHRRLSIVRHLSSSFTNCLHIRPAHPSAGKTMASTTPIMPFLRPLRLPRPSTVRSFLNLQFSTTARHAQTQPSQASAGNHPSPPTPQTPTDNPLSQTPTSSPPKPPPPSTHPLATPPSRAQKNPAPPGEQPTHAKSAPIQPGNQPTPQPPTRR